MKWLLTLLLYIPISGSYSQENANPYDVQVSTKLIGSRIQVEASYTAPLNICSAFAFITAYEGVKNIPGILESKVISREGNKVRVYRLIEEQILFIPVEIRSTVEYIEIPNRLLTFEQISGDLKFYKGSWKLKSGRDLTTFKYESLVEPNLLIPSFISEYFMKNSLRGRFEVMAHMASQFPKIEPIDCK